MAGKGSTVLCFKERQAIERLIKDGWTYGSIANELNRSHSGIKTEVGRNGGACNYSAVKAQERADAAREARAAKIRRGLSEGELELLHKMVSEGQSMNKISLAVGVSHFCLRRLMRERNLMTSRRNYTAFEERIETLEEQVKLILEIIEGLGAK